MSVEIDQSVDPNAINELLASIFQDMAQLGDRVLKPFLQDVVQFPALFQTLAKTSLNRPQLVLKILPQVGVVTLSEWLFHYFNLAGYTALYQMGRSFRARHPFLPPKRQYLFRRWLDALEYGSGQDYEHQESSVLQTLQENHPEGDQVNL